MKFMSNKRIIYQVRLRFKKHKNYFDFFCKSYCILLNFVV